MFQQRNRDNNDIQLLSPRSIELLSKTPAGRKEMHRQSMAAKTRPLSPKTIEIESPMTPREAAISAAFDKYINPNFQEITKPLNSATLSPSSKKESITFDDLKLFENPDINLEVQSQGINCMNITSTKWSSRKEEQ